MAKKLKTFQDWCIDTLSAILNAKKDYRGSLADQGYKYTLKAIIDHYASMYYCGAGNVSPRSREREHINLWWDHLSERSRRKFFAPLLMSKEAAKICLDCERGVDEFGGHEGLLRLEHITPKGYIYDKLQRLKRPTTPESVAKCFKYSKLVLLTRCESNTYLDGTDAAFTQKDVDMLHKTFPVDEEELAEAQNLVGVNPKSKGSGLLRMIRLYYSGVRFVNSHRCSVQPHEWQGYLSDCSNEIKDGTAMTKSGESWHHPQLLGFTPPKPTKTAGPGEGPSKRDVRTRHRRRVKRIERA